LRFARPQRSSSWSSISSSRCTLRSRSGGKFAWHQDGPRSISDFIPVDASSACSPASAAHVSRSSFAATAGPVAQMPPKMRACNACPARFIEIIFSLVAEIYGVGVGKF